MNKYIVNGNLVKEIDLQFVAGTGTAVLKNTIASKRKFKEKGTDEYKSDFIPVVAFGKTAEFIANNFIKGQGIQIEARMQSGSYEKDGVKHYTLEAVVENVEFYGSKKNQGNTNSFGEDMTPVDDGDIPF
ncbi:single-stranded DNA-binding protein [Inconstantimicrobium mannanitabidum]|uniref:Single-stranded DNA-binding protein 3 n=1 Tax=Inconstantimicrobium mannanitabidum TaxID=1604901 RepID=A0ACB5R9I7_9CLOT|nr:single-stranded DNA-binding protein [Clostridium sp. TW13]GKX65626.1 single-stranded DNA-binding protein 3 [Clostridium sp. TW13]